MVLGDGAYCSGAELWQLKHDLLVDFVVRATTTMRVCADARGLMQVDDALVTRAGTLWVGRTWPLSAWPS